MTSQASVSINVSLAEIYDLLCPECREAVVHLLSAKAGADLFREAVRARLAPAAESEPEQIGSDGPR
ncbi:MAG: hypothetical protein A2Y61_03970 [Chloroflexi bacterium RBG_13_60_13]|nr:MAG: hypothetical protein A2Y61_03970 [Chloroflexi bacterium RBG_13_60_13]